MSLVAHVPQYPPPPHANSFVLGPAVINTHKLSAHCSKTPRSPRSCAPRPTPSSKMFKNFASSGRGREAHARVDRTWLSAAESAPKSQHGCLEERNEPFAFIHESSSDCVSFGLENPKFSEVISVCTCTDPHLPLTKISGLTGTGNHLVDGRWWPEAHRRVGWTCRALSAIRSGEAALGVIEKVYS